MTERHETIYAQEKSRNLAQCHIAGFAHYDGLDVYEKLQVGTSLRLRAEPWNKYDPEAIAVYYGDHKLGFVPRDRNALLSQLMHFGYGDILEATINRRVPEASPEMQFHFVVRLKDRRPHRDLPRRDSKRMIPDELAILVLG
jgi:hypothetical protein